MKNTLSKGHYIIFKSIFPFWYIPENDLKVQNYAWYETTSTEQYYVTFTSIFAFWDILEHDLKKVLILLLRMKTA